MARRLAILAALAAVLVTPAVAAKAPATNDAVAYYRAAFTTGTPEGVLAGSTLTFGSATGTLAYDDPFDTTTATTTYELARWTSPMHAVGFGATEIVSSWTADTPHGTWIQVELRGPATKWYVLGRWTSQMPSATDIHRTSVGGQGDADGFVAIDTFFTAKKAAPLDAYQLRVTLYRLPGTSGGPTVRSLGAIASALPDERSVPAGPHEVTRTLAVPTYSQETHIGEYPEFDNGGEAWCSPTSTEMVVEYWGQGPSAGDVAGIPYADPSVDYAAMHVFDWHYDGAGNWPFNVAYASSFGLEGEVVQLRSLAEAERFIAAGIPLVVSVAFKKGELDGAGYGTNGHLMVIRGFDANGDVVANDPASHLVPSNGAVETTYDRQQFADVWLPSSRSGGIAYVIHPADVALPANVAGLPANW
jgi:Peptidase_C39 like family